MKKFKSKRKFNLIINNIIIFCVLFFLICYSIIMSLKNKISDELITDIVLKNNKIDFKLKSSDILKYAFNYVPEDKDETIVVMKETNEKNETNNNSDPIIYIYNTHQSEKYLSNENNDYDVGIYLASFMLQEKLNKLGISSIVEKTNITEILKINNWNYASSYKVSRMLLEDTKNKYPSLKMFIDLHRDSSKREKTIINIDNKTYAKILFIVGLDNINYEKNLLVTERINNLLKEYNNDLSRGIYKKSGKGVNGIYNQDFDPKTILIELGGQYNYIEEVNNTIDILSKVLSEYVKEIT